MEFHSRWICHPDFVGAERLDFYSKELVTKNKLREEDPRQNHHTYFASKVCVREGSHYLARVTADDYYKLYVNGVFVCQGPSPSYRQFYAYNEVDLTPYLKQGENVIALHIFYQGLLNRVWCSADGREGAILDLFEDGVYLWGTDEHWLCHLSEEYETGVVIGYHTQLMENLNFLKKVPGLSRMEGDGWQAVALNPDHGHVFCDCVPTVEVYRRKPTLVVEREDGYFFDFGQELVGQPYFLAHGRAGEKVIVECSEEQVEGDTRCRVPMRANCEYREECTLSGGVDEFDFYDYRGFRYLNLYLEDKSVIDLDSVCMLVRHHPFSEEKGKYEGKDEKLGAIWELCRNTIRYATQEIFPDCPTREKGQYLGDFTVTGLSHLYLTGDAEKYRKTLFDFARSTMICPGMMAIAPCSHMQEIADFSLQYPLQVWNYYKVTKDKATVTRLLPTVRGILSHFSRFENRQGLLEGVYDKWNLVDWPKNLRDGYDAELPTIVLPDTLHNVINAHYLGAILMLSKLEDATEEPRTFTDEDIERRKRLFRDTFYLSDRGLYADLPVARYEKEGRDPHSALHSNIIPAFYGFAEAEAKGPILDMIEKKGLCCGVQFSYFVLKACANLGDRELEYRLVTNESEHSWFNMLREGATTTLEAWGKDEKNNCSFCHPWATAPIIAIVEDLMN